jgi:Zn-dependent M28 family amino/carboxypeptidase
MAFLAGLALVGCAAGPAAQVAPAPATVASEALPAIDPAALARHVETLASDAFEGRAPATRGEHLTLGYMIAQFQEAGLKPGPGGWLQPVPLQQSLVSGAPGISVRSKAGAKTYAYRAEQVIWSKRPDAEISLKDAPLVFVGYGIVAPEKGWNDYAGVDMKGKIAIILVNDPDYETGPDHPSTGLFDGRAMTWYGRWPYKYEEAARQGAAGALIIHETGPAAYPFAVVQSSWTGPQFDTVRPDKGASRAAIEGWVSSGVAADLFARSGLDFARLKAAAQKKGFSPVPMGDLKLSATLRQTVETSTSYNVVAMLPGTTRPDEVVLYGAHHDHLGRCPGDPADDICNGAIDNAGGVAMLLEIARAFAKQGPRARTVAFIGWAAEEKGLLGSEYYATNPVFAPAKTVAGVNMDGVAAFGRSKDMSIVGYGKSELDDHLARALARQGRVTRPEPFPERGGFYRSDHFPLAKIGIPMLYAGAGVDLFEGGVARGEALANDYVANRYHKPNDEFDPSWDMSGAAENAAALAEVGRGIAEGAGWPKWAPNAEFRAAREASLAVK